MNAYYARFAKVIALIPPGKVASYGQIADLAGLPGRARMVGKAMSELENVPWHRVLRSSGELAFASGSEHFKEQRARLMDEGVVVKGRRVSMAGFGWRPDLSVLLSELEY